MSASEKKNTDLFNFSLFDLSPFLFSNTSFSPFQDWFKDNKKMESLFTQQLFPDLNQTGIKWYNLATEQIQTLMDEYWKLLGLVPQNEYERLLKQYNDIKRKLEEKEDVKKEEANSRLQKNQAALKAAEEKIKNLEEEVKNLKAPQEDKKTAEKKPTEKKEDKKEDKKA